MSNSNAMSRRTALATFGAAGAAALLASCKSIPGVPTTTTRPLACAVLTKEQEQGPFYYPSSPRRSNLSDGKPGVPMKLVLAVMDVTTCTLIPNAAVDVWTADALGAYSNSSTGLFLRGYQMTNAKGLVAFSTIYPGWYPGRTNHVHVKVHVGGTSAGSHYSGGHVSHTGNLFFPEDVSVTVAKIAPYPQNPAHRTVLTSDGVYSRQNGSGSIMTVTPVDPANPAKGYVASRVLGIDPTADPALIGIHGTVR